MDHLSDSSGALLFVSVSVLWSVLFYRSAVLSYERSSHSSDNSLTSSTESDQLSSTESDPLPIQKDSSDDGNKDLKVVVIGAGIGGLATAVALQMEGIECVVYERDKRFEDRRQGFGLTLSRNMNGPLSKLGILDKCIQEDCASRCHWVFTPEGKVIGYYGRAFKGKQNTGSQECQRTGNLRIPRQRIREMLLDRLQPGTVVWGKPFTGCEASPNGDPRNLRAHFKDGTYAVGDVIVGADGLRSRVRRYRDEAVGGTGEELRYIGVSVIIGISRCSHPLLDGQGFYVLDGTHRLFTMPFSTNPDGTAERCMWQLSFSGLSLGEALLLKGAGPRAQLSEAHIKTLGWLDPVREMIELTDEGEVWATPLFDRPPMRLRRGGRRTRHKPKASPTVAMDCVTVLGDACHPMSMFKGQGANQALQDAPLLASWLAKGGKYKSVGIEKKVQLFEREMVSRTTSRVEASFEASRMLHSPEVMDSAFPIEGISEKDATILLNKMEELSVGASCDDLEKRMTDIYAAMISS